MLLTADEALNRAFKAHQSGQLSEAESLYEAILKVHPQHLDALNNLATLYFGRQDLQYSLKYFFKANIIEPGFGESYNNIGSVYIELGDACLSLKNYRRAIIAKPEYSEALYNIGKVFESSKNDNQNILNYRKAIQLTPGFSAAWNNLGNIERGRYNLDTATRYYRYSIISNSKYSPGHTNLGVLNLIIGDKNGAIDAYEKLLKIEPDYVDGYYNLGSALQIKGLVNDAREYFQKGFEIRQREPLTCLKNETFALLTFGRSGSFFAHSLFDGHPELSTIPGIYLKSWFGHNSWERFAPNFCDPEWREKFTVTVLREFQPLFNATSRKNVVGEPLGNTNWLSKDCGFLEMGKNRDEPFRLDSGLFSKKLSEMLASLEFVDQASCFRLLHDAFHKAYRLTDENTSSVNLKIFYHLHNPKPDEMIGFLKACPNHQLIYIVRHPVQTLESWMLTDIAKGITLRRWLRSTIKFEAMIQSLCSPFNGVSAIGVRLEDLKKNPKETLEKLTCFMGIDNHKELYKSEFCGLKYWGPTSTQTGPITGFDTKSIDKPLGRLFGKQDIFILETLFWPFSKLFNYTDLSKSDYKTRLKIIRPYLNAPFEFEKNLYGLLKDNSRSLTDLSPYKAFHRKLINAWEILDAQGTYPCMMSFLKN